MKQIGNPEQIKDECEPPGLRTGIKGTESKAFNFIACSIHYRFHKLLMAYEWANSYQLPAYV